MFIPCLQYLVAIVAQQLADGIQFYRRKAVVASQYDRFHPVLAYPTLPLHMHMLGFAAIEADEEQSVRTRNSANRWHGVIIGVTPTENKRPRLSCGWRSIPPCCPARFVSLLIALSLMASLEVLPVPLRAKAARSLTRKIALSRGVAGLSTGDRNTLTSNALILPPHSNSRSPYFKSMKVPSVSVTQLQPVTSDATAMVIRQSTAVDRDRGGQDRIKVQILMIGGPKPNVDYAKLPMRTMGRAVQLGTTKDNKLAPKWRSGAIYGNCRSNL